jgi:hypothetical protein
MTENETDNPAGPDAEDLAPWERRRRQSQAELKSANAHGQQLLERYGRETPRPRAVVGYANAKRRR